MSEGVKPGTPLPWNMIEAKTLCHIETDEGNPIGQGVPICSIPKAKVKDATYIYEACNAYPSLSAKITTLEAENKRLREALERASLDFGCDLLRDGELRSCIEREEEKE